MLRGFSELLFYLYCFVWFRIPLGEDTGIPFQRLIAWICAVGLIGNFFLLKNFPMKHISKKIFLFSFLFLLYLILSFFIQGLFIPAFSNKYFLMDFSKYIAIFGCLFVTYFVLKQNLISESKFEKIIIISGVLSISISFILYFLYLLGLRSENEIFVRSFGGALGVWPTSVSWFPRLAGTTSEPQQFSIIFLTPLLLMLQKQYLKKYILPICFGIFALVLSQSKFAVFSLFFIFLYLFITRKKYRVLFFLLGILTLPLLGVILIKLPVFASAISLGAEGQAFSERYENLVLLIDIIKDHFFFGIGAGQYGIYRGVQIYGDSEFEPSYKPNLDYLKIFSETGIIGFVLIFLMMGFMFIKFYSYYKSLFGKEKERYLAILLGSIAIFFNMFIGYEFLHVFFWINMGYLLYAAERKSIVGYYKKLG